MDATIQNGGKRERSDVVINVLCFADIFGNLVHIF